MIELDYNTYTEVYTEVDKLKGRKVKVIGVTVKRYRDVNILGCVGIINSVTITNGFPCTIRKLSVKIDGKYNPSSETGSFWFPPEDLILIEENNIEMNNLKNAKMCVVKDDSKNIINIALTYADVSIGDLVVCDYDYGNGKLSVRRVVDLIVGSCDKPYTSIVVGVVDTSDYKKHKEIVKRRSELERQMNLMSKQVEREVYFKFLATESKEFSKIYEEYKSLCLED